MKNIILYVTIMFVIVMLFSIIWMCADIWFRKDIPSDISSLFLFSLVMSIIMIVILDKSKRKKKL
jgi:hypothetical protein